MKQSIIILTLVVMIFFSGCTDGDGSNDNNQEEEKKELNTVQLEGTWKSNCWLFLGVYTQTSSTFLNNNYSFTWTSYSDTSCSIVDTSYGTTSITGVFVIGKSTITDSGLKANEIDFTYLKYNGKDINETEYSLFIINDEKLYFGKNGTTVETRPTDINMTKYLTKEGSLPDTPNPEIVQPPNENNLSKPIGLNDLRRAFFRRGTIATFKDGTYTTDFITIFSQSVAYSKNTNPQKWGEWRVLNGKLQLKLDDENTFEWKKILIASPANSKPKYNINKCFQRLIDNVIGDSEFIYVTHTWCFQPDGYFTFKSASVFSEKIYNGRYKINGYTMRTIYDDGRDVTRILYFLGNDTSAIYVDGVLYANHNNFL